MSRNLVIIGANGHGRVAADIALKMNKWRQIVFLDDNENIKSSMGIDVIGKSTDAFSFINTNDVFVAIGDNKIREKKLIQLEQAGANITSLIHPNVIIGRDVIIGTGSAVMAGVIINSCSKIGKGCIINTGATIDHDNIIENYVHISPGVHLAGTVSIGKHSWLGIGVVVSNNISINRDCTIGAGTVVINDICDAGTYMGVPAKKISK